MTLCSRPSPEELRRVFSYEPETGILRWKVARSPRNVIGSEAGTTKRKNRRYVGYRQRRYYTHILAWVIVAGEWPVHEIDHRDCNPGNNRWDNLREATSSQNKANTRRRSNNKSGVKGVFLSKRDRKWYAEIRKDGRKTFLGSFDTVDAASAAYARAAREMFGEFARLA